MVDMQREEWLQLLLNELPDRLFVLNQDGLFIEGFGGTFHSTRLDNPHSTQNSLQSLLDEEKASELSRALSEVVLSQQTKVIQYSISAVNCPNLSIEQLEAFAEDAWFEATIKPLCTLGETTYILWQERDVTGAYAREQDLKRLSETDELTGILNRRAFIHSLQEAFNSVERSNLSCLMVDIDHFKEINDQVGHLSGDEVISHVAQLCQQQIRASDAVGRLGGEEFGVMLSHTSAIQAYDIAERIRRSIADTPCQVDDKTIYPTVSIGIAEADATTHDVKTLLVQADKAMYYSKHTGRNQVTLYHDSLPDMKIQPSNKTHILIAS